MRKALQLAGLMVLLSCSVLAQSPTASPDELLAQARKTYAEQGAQDALPQFESALAAFKAAGDARGEAITTGLIGNCYKKLGDYERARQMLEQALAMKQKLGDQSEEGRTLSHLGLLFWETADYPRAIEHFNRSVDLARKLSDRQLEGSSLNNLGLVYDEQGDYKKSLDHYERALVLHRAVKFERGESDALGNIGGVHLLLGRYREALTYYQQSLAIGERNGFKPSMVQDLGNIGFCYLGMGRLSEARTTFDRALRLAREAGMKKEEAELLKGEGSGLLSLGKFNAALEQYSLALKVYDSAGLKREKVEALSDRGTVMLMLGDLVSAERDFAQARDLAQAIGNARGVTANLLALGDLEARRARPERAAALYREVHERSATAGDQDMLAVSLLRLAGMQRELDKPEQANISAMEALEVARAQSAAPAEAEALLLLADMLRALGQLTGALDRLTETEKIAVPIGNPDLTWRVAYTRGRVLEELKRPDEAIAEYRKAVETIEAVHADLREDRYRSGYLQDKTQVYIALIRLLLRQGKGGDAFSFAERLRVQGKAGVLERNLPPQIAQREIELRMRIRRLQRAIEEEAEKGSRSRGQATAVFSEDLAAVQREYQNLLDDVQRGRPAGRSLVATEEQVRKNLPSDAALLEYIVADDSVLMFVLTRDQLHATSAQVRRDELEASIELFRDLLGRKRGNDWHAPSQSLGRGLIQPLEGAGWLRDCHTLFIVPHGVLHYLPFAALERTGPSGSRLLVEDYVLQYLPSASLLAATAPPEDNHNRVLAVAPSRSRLAFAAREVQGIRALFPRETRALVGKGATESSFRRLAGDYSILHLATHGFFNKLNPLFSGVQLEADAQEDGRLEVHEILELHLRARLVTLSACETALGSGYFNEVPAGDDFIGLTQAFLSAGSSSVLATLWDVNDRSTLQFMTGFYQNLPSREGSDALAAAQRKMLAGPVRYRHPYYWAPFVLVGPNRITQEGIVAEKSLSRP